MFNRRTILFGIFMYLSALTAHANGLTDLRDQPFEIKVPAVVNFWATWCSPCVKELPYFEEVNKKLNEKNTEVILVSLDFPSQIESKLKPYLTRNKIKSKVILLDDSKMNTWVPKVSEQWDGGIPATLIVNSSNYNFYPKPFKKEELFSEINKVIK